MHTWFPNIPINRPLSPCNIPIHIATSVQEAVEDADIICTRLYTDRYESLFNEAGEFLLPARYIYDRLSQ